MKIGPDNWRSISIDEPFVPRGGMYGDVDGFAAKAAAHGLQLCWSWWRKCFCVYTVHYGREVFQWRFWNDRLNRPEPLTDFWLWLLVEVREKHGRLDGEDFAQTCARAAAEEDEQVRHQQERAGEDIVNDVARETGYAFGKTRPLRLIMPGTRGRLGNRAVKTAVKAIITASTGIGAAVTP
ncbi:MAG TPA: hypothetical protein VMY35_11600 [Phycisphaerae bacterium]|nr:hypothetical protein [Phycisphaerae bacterium]